MADAGNVIGDRLRHIALRINGVNLPLSSELRELMLQRIRESSELMKNQPFPIYEARFILEDDMEE